MTHRGPFQPQTFCVILRLVAQKPPMSSHVFPGCQPQSIGTRRTNAPRRNKTPAGLGIPFHHFLKV